MHVSYQMDTAPAVLMLTWYGNALARRRLEPHHAGEHTFIVRAFRL